MQTLTSTRVSHINRPEILDGVQSAMSFTFTLFVSISMSTRKLLVVGLSALLATLSMACTKYLPGPVESLFKVADIQKDTVFSNVEGIPSEGSYSGRIAIRARGEIDSPVAIYLLNSSGIDLRGKTSIPAGNIDTTLLQSDFYEATCLLVYKHLQAKSGHLRFFIEYSSDPNDTLGQKPFPR